MVDDEAERLHQGAREWLEAARSEALAGRHHVAFEAARHAAELACKAILMDATGSYPKKHDVTGPLAQAGRLPLGVDGRALSRLFGAFTAGTYGFDETMTPERVARAIAIAEACVAASSA